MRNEKLEQITEESLFHLSKLRAYGRTCTLARLKERTEDADERGYKSHSTVIEALKRID